MSRTNTALVVIALILGAAGATIGAFSIFAPQIIGIDNSPGEDGDDGDDGYDGINGIDASVLVGVWEDLGRNTGYAPHNLQNNWLISVSDQQVIKSASISLSRSNTRFTLLRNGWYKISLYVGMTSIADGLMYVLYIYKNGAQNELIGRIVGETSEGPNYIVTYTAYILSDGNDYFDLNWYESTGDDFYIPSTPESNQLVIETVGT